MTVISEIRQRYIEEKVKIRNVKLGNQSLSLPAAGLTFHALHGRDVEFVSEFEQRNSGKFADLSEIQLIEFPCIATPKILRSIRPEFRSFLHGRIIVSLPYTEHFILASEKLAKIVGSQIKEKSFRIELLRDLIQRKYLDNLNNPNDWNEKKRGFGDYITEIKPQTLGGLINFYYETQIRTGSPFLIPPATPILDCEKTLTNAININRLGTESWRHRKFAGHVVSSLFNFSAEVFDDQNDTLRIARKIKDFIVESWESQSSGSNFQLPEVLFFKIYTETKLTKNQRIENFRLFLDNMVTIANEMHLYTFFLGASRLGLASLFKGIDGYTFPPSGVSHLKSGGGGAVPMDKWNMYHFDIFDWTKFGQFKTAVRSNGGEISYLPRIGYRYDLDRLKRLNQYELYRFTREYASEAVNIQTEQFIRDTLKGEMKSAEISITRRNRSGIYRRFFKS